MKLGLRALLLFGAAVLPSCKTAPPPSSPPVTSSPTASARQQLAERLPLTSYLSKVGLRWLVQIRPKALLADPEVRKDWSKLLRPKGLAALSLTTGVKIDEMKEIWIAGYGLGTLYLFDGTHADEALEESFKGRARSLDEQTTRVSDLHRMTAVIDRAPFALLRIDRHMIAIAEGDPSLLRFAEARALGKMSDDASIFGDEFLGPFSNKYPHAQLRVFARGPFAEAKDSIVADFVSGIAAFSFSPGKLEAQVDALGLWPINQEGSQEMGTWLTALLETREFRALGLTDAASEFMAPSCGSPEPPFKPEDGLSYCQSSARFDSQQLSSSIWRLTAAPMDELMKSPVAVAPESSTSDEAN